MLEKNLAENSKNKAENSENKADNSENKADNSENKRKYEQKYQRQNYYRRSLTSARKSWKKCGKNSKRLLFVCAALKTRNQNKTKIDQITVS